MDQSDISIRTATPEEWDLAFSDDAKDEQRGCIGHLRIDFGSDGKEFWNSWWGHQEELLTPSFQSDLENVVNALWEASALKNQGSMTSYCYSHDDARMGEAWDADAYGFMVETGAYTYGVRLQSKPGNHSYIYAYDATMLALAQGAESIQQEGPRL